MAGGEVRLPKNPVDWALGLASGDESPESRRSMLVSLWTMLVLCIVVESVWQSTIHGAPGPRVTIEMLVLVACVGLAQVRRLERLAICAASAVTASHLVDQWEFCANHFMLYTFALFLLALLDLRLEEDQLLGIQAMRWVAVVVLFYSGVQKLIYGTYFHGEFLGYKMAVDEVFAKPFQWVLSVEEFARLRSLDGEGFGGGQYRPDSLLVVVASNLVYLFEILAPFLLMARRFRSGALVVGLVFISMVQIAAREYFFAAGFLALLLTFAKKDWIRWLIWIFLTVFLLALGAQGGYPWR